jgi:hypothetical protein
MSLDIRSRIEEIRSRIATRKGILGQGIAAGGGIAPGGFKVFGQQEGTILDRVRARAEEIRKRVTEMRPGILPTPTLPTPSSTPTGTPPSSPTPLPQTPVKTYTTKIKTY